MELSLLQVKGMIAVVRLATSRSRIGCKKLVCDDMNWVLNW